MSLLSYRIIRTGRSFNSLRNQLTRLSRLGEITDEQASEVIDMRDTIEDVKAKFDDFKAERGIK